MSAVTRLAPRFLLWLPVVFTVQYFLSIFLTVSFAAPMDTVMVALLSLDLQSGSHRCQLA
jgi:hypothetical protein